MGKGREETCAEEGRSLPTRTGRDLQQHERQEKRSSAPQCDAPPQGGLCRKNTGQQVLLRMQRNWSPVFRQRECPLVQPLQRNSAEVPQQNRNRTPMWPRNPTSRSLSIRIHNRLLKRYLQHHSPHTRRKPPRCSSADKWIKKMWYAYKIKIDAAFKKRRKSCHRRALW